LAAKRNIKHYALNNEAPPQNQFKMQRMEDIFDLSQGQTDTPHRHDYYTIVWVKEGQGHHQIDFETYAITGRQVFFVNPGKVHQVHTPERPRGCVISFTPAFLQANNISEDFILNINLFKQYGEAPPVETDRLISLKLSRIVTEMFELYQGQVPFKSVALGALLRLFLVYCNMANTPRQQDEEPPETHSMVIRFRQAVEADYKIAHKVSYYAELLNVTPKYLTEVLSTNAGFGPKEYIQNRIITEAKRQLLFSKRSVKEVAHDLGFKELFHFSAFFKNVVGLSPKAFKEQQRGA